MTTRHARFFCFLAFLLTWFSTLVGASAQTNASAQTALTDAEKFFQEYPKAVQLIASKKQQQAAITMDLLYRAMQTSPWMEIALLKHTELIESTSSDVAMEHYKMLANRLAAAPYFQGDTEHARVFRAALQGAVDNGINRVRLQRVRDALSKYYTRYHEYPESLTKLSLFGYIEMADIRAANDRNFRYLPAGQRLDPFVSFHSYDLEPAIPESFSVKSPRIEGTSRISEEPPKYAALIKVPNRIDALRVTEDQTLEGYFIATVAPGGAIVCSYNRVLILPVTPEKK